jgi:excisionase family DNA binding protein
MHDREKALPGSARSMENDLEPVRLLTLRQTAEALNLSRQTLRLLRGKKLPGVKIGGQWRIRESDLTKFIHDLDSRSCNPSNVRTNCCVNLRTDQGKKPKTPRSTDARTATLFLLCYKPAGFSLLE